jgi:hypothetical protein
MILRPFSTPSQGSKEVVETRPESLRRIPDHVESFGKLAKKNLSLKGLEFSKARVDESHFRHVFSRCYVVSSQKIWLKRLAQVALFPVPYPLISRSPLLTDDGITAL